jgi:hypothetical protein
VDHLGVDGVPGPQSNTARPTVDAVTPPTARRGPGPETHMVAGNLHRLRDAAAASRRSLINPAEVRTDCPSRSHVAYLPSIRAPRREIVRSGASVPSPAATSGTSHSGCCQVSDHAGRASPGKLWHE